MKSCFCKKCKKRIENRIKYLESMDKGKPQDTDRAHIIQQLQWLLDGGQDGKLG